MSKIKIDAKSISLHNTDMRGNTQSTLCTYLNSLFKTGPEFIVKQTWTKLTIYNRNYDSPAMQKLLADPDGFMQKNILKNDSTFTTTVSLATIDAQPLVIKRYNIKSFKHGFKRALTPTRARKCWLNAHRLLWLDIATPKPVAMIEKRFGPLHRQAYYIYEYIEGPQGFDVFRDKLGSLEETQLKAKKTVDLLMKMLTNNISHGDMKASNIIFAKNQPYFIDLDAMQYHPSQFKAIKKKQKDVRRFMENWENLPVKAIFAKLLADTKL